MNPEKTEAPQPLSFDYTLEEGIGRLTFNRPDTYNAFDLEMVAAFEAFLQERRYDEDTRVIVLDGAEPRAFAQAWTPRPTPPRYSRCPPWPLIMPRHA